MAPLKIDSGEKIAAVPKFGFRHTLNTVKQDKNWISPFRQRPAGTPGSTSKEAPSSKTETKIEKVAKETEKESEPVEVTKSLDPALQNGNTANDTNPVVNNDVTETGSANVVDVDAAPVETKETTIEKKESTEAPKKKVVVDTIVDLGGGLKLPQSKIDAIARERLSKNFEAIDIKVSEQSRLRDLKNQKKAELKALKDQTKVNSTFAKFKRKLDLDKKSFGSLHNQKVTELESSIADIEAQMKDFDKKTLEEIEKAKEDHSSAQVAADEKLVEDKEKTEVWAAEEEVNKKQEIHDTQISQKRHGFDSSVLEAKQSEYQVSLQLLVLQLAQTNRDLAKQKGAHLEHTSTKQELETKISELKGAISANKKLIEDTEQQSAESTKALEESEKELLDSKASLENVRLELVALRAGKDSRVDRIHDAESKRELYEAEEERLRIEAEKERERLAEEAAERKRLEKERLAEEKRQREIEEERLAKEAEDARIAKEVEDANAAKQEELNKLENVTKVDVTDNKPVSKAAIAATAAAAGAAGGAVGGAVGGAAAAGSSAATNTASVGGTAKNAVPDVDAKTPKKKRFSGLFNFKKNQPEPTSTKEEAPKEKKSKNLLGGLLTGTGAAVAGAAGTAAVAGGVAAATVGSAAGTGTDGISKIAELSSAKNKSADVSLPEANLEDVSDVPAKNVEELPTEVKAESQSEIKAEQPDVELEKPVTEENKPKIETAEPNEEESVSKPEDIEPAVAEPVEKDGLSTVIPAAVTLPTPPQTAEEAKSGSYTEPAPVEIPEDQKFTIPEDLKEPITDEVDTTNEAPETSRESTPEPDAVSSKNAKKNAKKRERKKKKKAAEKALAAGAVAGAAAGAVAGSVVAAAHVESNSEIPSTVSISDISTDVQEATPDVENVKTAALESIEAPISTDDVKEQLPTGTYQEPEPVQIPASQKFAVVPTFSPPEAEAGSEDVSSVVPKKEAESKSIADSSLPVSGLKTSVGDVNTNNASVATISSAVNTDKALTTGEDEDEEVDNDTDSLYSIREVITYEEFTPEEEAALYASVKAAKA